MNTKTVKEKCKLCNGDGYTAEHDLISNHNPEDGSCITCPIQVQCEKCEGTGFVLDKLYTNEMPSMLLDDDIADWEHDNLVENG